MGPERLVIVELKRPDQLTGQVCLRLAQRLDPEKRRAAVTHRDKGEAVLRPMGEEQLLGSLHDGMTEIEKLEACDSDGDGQQAGLLAEVFVLGQDVAPDGDRQDSSRRTRLWV